MEANIWEYSVNFGSESLPAYGPPGVTKQLGDKLRQLRGKNQLIHTIQTIIDPFRFVDQEIMSKTTNVQKQLESMVAETLLHELVHVTIMIEQALPARSERTSTYRSFELVWKAANSASLNKERTAVYNDLIILITLARQMTETVAIPSEEMDKARKLFEYLIQEHYAKQKAAKAFARNITNKEIARIYVDEAALRIYGEKHPSGTWVKRKENLVENITILYHLIDEMIQEYEFYVDSQTIVLTI